MKYLTLLKANIKSQKGSFIGISLLMFIITVSLLAVLTIWKNANDYEEEQLLRTGYGDITSWIEGKDDIEKLCGQIEALSDVWKVEVQDAIGISKYYVNGQEGVTGILQIFAFGQERYTYHIFNKNLTGIEESAEELSDGEVYVSPAFCSLYDAQAGDEISIQIAGEKDRAVYTIKGFFEDPSAGSALMGIKSILMNTADMEKLSKRIEGAESQEQAAEICLLHIFQSEQSTLSMLDFQNLLGEKTEVNDYASFSYSSQAIKGFMLILQNIFVGFLLVFVVVLLMITMVVIGHSISSCIEQDYVNMGILKAVGFTRADLKRIQILQYVLAVLVGMVPGSFLSGMVARLINRLMVTTTGLLIPEDGNLSISMAALSVILCLLTAFISLKTTGIGKITPIRAIRGGADDVYFSSRLTTRIYQRGLILHLAFRQLLSGKKQYVSACMVAALLVFFISLTVRIDVWMGPDGKGFMNEFSPAKYDIGFECEDKELEREVDALIARNAQIAARYEFKMERAVIDNYESSVNIASAPEYFNVIKGRSCKYGNEVLVTDLVADVIEAQIGDTVLVSYKGKELEFIISGIYQCVNDMGDNFAISKEGWERFESEPISFFQYYILEDSSQTGEIADLLNENYKDRIDIDENGWSGLGAILSVMSAIEVFMYVITAVFILVAVYLTGSKVLYKEKRDLGIYKSLGFTAGQLRMSFALRFCMMAVIGSVLGNVLSGLFTDSLVTAMLTMCGVSRFESSLSPLQMLFSGVVVSGLFLIFAYLAAGKIKKMEPSILIVE